MAVTCKWVLHGTGTEWSSIACRIRMAVPPSHSVCLCVGRQLQGMCHLRDKFWHHADWEYSPVKLFAANSVRFPAGEVQGFTPFRPLRVCWHIRPRREWPFSLRPSGGLRVSGGARLTWAADESAPHIVGGGGDRGDQRFPRVWRWGSGLGPPGRGLCVWCARFFSRCCFVFGIASSQLSGCCVLWLRLLRPGRVVAVTLGCLAASVTGWGEVFGLVVKWWWPWRHAPSNDMIPPLA